MATYSRRSIGAAEPSLGAASVAIWLPYDFGIESVQVGYAAAEAVALASPSVWTVLTVLRRRRYPRRPPRGDGDGPA